MLAGTLQAQGNLFNMLEDTTDAAIVSGLGKIDWKRAGSRFCRIQLFCANNFRLGTDIDRCWPLNRQPTSPRTKCGQEPPGMSFLSFPSGAKRILMQSGLGMCCREVPMELVS